MSIKNHLPWLLPTLIFTILVLLGTNAHPLWGDEAETVLFARNILRFRIPRGWDGVNIIGLADGIYLNSDLVNYVSPWLQFYLAAFSIRLFGDSAFTARLPFIFFSIFSIPLFYFLSHNITGSKRIAFLATLCLSLSVPFILFAYQARYYSLVSFAGIVLVLACQYLSKKSWAKILFVFSSVLLFYGNYVVFVMFFLSLVVSMMLVLWAKGDKRDKWGELRTFLQTTVVLSVITLFCTAPWFMILQPWAGERITGALPKSNNLLTLFSIITYDAFYPFNLANAFPILFVPLIIWVIIRKLRHKESIVQMSFLLFLSVFFLLGMVLVTLTTNARDTAFVNVRYTMVIFPYLVLASVWSIDKLISWKKGIGLLVLALYLFTTVFTLSKPRILLLDYLGEVTHPYLLPDKVVADYLEKNATTGDTTFVSLDRDHVALMYHLRDKIRFVNQVTPRNPRLFPKNREVLPRYVFDFQGLPDWVIVYGKMVPDTSFYAFDYRQLPSRINLKRDYEEKVLPIFFSDLSRPELEFHSFTEVLPASNEQVFIYKKRKGYSRARVSFVAYIQTCL